MTMFWALLAVYMLVLVGVGWWSGRNESEEDYLIAGRNRPWWHVAFSKYAVTIGAAWFVTYTAFAYEYGANILTFIFGMMAGYLFFAFWGAKRIKTFSTEGGGFYTMGELVRNRTGSLHAEQLLNITTIAAAFFYLTVGVVAGGILMEEFGLISYELAVFLTFFVTTAYVLMSGFKAIVLTDVIQGILLVVLLIGVVWGFSLTTGVDMHAVSESRPIDWLTVLMFTIFGVVTTFSSPDRYQLSYAGKSIKTLKLGFTMAFIPVFVSALALLVIGSHMYVIDPTIDSSAAFPRALALFLPAVVAPFALVMFFAGLMSSVDTNLYVIASHIKTRTFEVLTRTTTRTRILFVGIISAIVALAFRDVVDLTILAAGIQTAIAFPMIYLIAGGSSKIRFLLVVYCGLIGLVLGIWFWGLEPKAAAFVLAGNSIGALIPKSLAGRFIANTEGV